MTTRIKLRRDTSVNWITNNPILALGEPGLDTDSNQVKYGDGVTHWNNLAYSAASGGSGVESRWVGLYNTVGYGEFTTTSTNGVTFTGPHIIEGGNRISYGVYTASMAIGANKIVYLNTDYSSFSWITYADSPEQIIQYPITRDITETGPNGEDTHWHTLVYTNGYFVITGDYYDSMQSTPGYYPIFAYSIDGLTWTRGSVDISHVAGLVAAEIGTDIYVTGMSISGIASNSTGWLFSLQWKYYGGSPISPANAGAYFVTSLDSTLGNINYRDIAPIAAYPDNAPWLDSAVHYDGVGWLMTDYLSNLYVNTTNDASGSWTTISLINAELLAFGDIASYTSINNVTAGTLNGVHMIIVVYTSGRMLISSDQGITWHGVVPLVEVSMILDLTNSIYGGIIFYNPIATGRIIIEGSPIPTMNGQFWLGDADFNGVFPIYQYNNKSIQVDTTTWLGWSVTVTILSGTYSSNIIYVTDSTGLMPGMTTGQFDSKNQIASISGNVITMKFPIHAELIYQTGVIFTPTVFFSYGGTINNVKMNTTEVLALGEMSAIATSIAPLTQDGWTWQIGAAWNPQIRPNIGASYLTELVYGQYTKLPTSWRYSPYQENGVTNTMSLSESFQVSVTEIGNYMWPNTVNLVLDPTLSGWIISSTNPFGYDEGSINSYGNNNVQMTIAGHQLSLNYDGSASLDAYTFPNSYGSPGQLLTWPGNGSILEWTTMAGGLPSPWAVSVTGLTAGWGGSQSLNNGDDLVISTGGTTGAIALISKENVSIYAGAGIGTDGYLWQFSQDGTLTLPDNTTLNSGGQGARNSAQLRTTVNWNSVHGSTIDQSSIAMESGNGGVAVFATGPYTDGSDGSGGPSLVFAGVENVSGINGPGFSGAVFIDPAVTSQYAILLDGSNNITIGATQMDGTVTTTEYTAGIGSLNKITGNMTGLVATPDKLVLNNNNNAWSFGTDGSLILPSTNKITAASIAAVGYQFNIDTLANGMTIINSNVIVLTETTNTDLIATGWIVTDINNNTTTVAGVVSSGGQTEFLTGSFAFDCQFPLTFTSPDYAVSSVHPVVINSNNNNWTFGTDGSTTLPAQQKIIWDTNSWTKSTGSHSILSHTSVANAYAETYQNENTLLMYVKDDLTAANPALVQIHAGMTTTETPKLDITIQKGSDGVPYVWNFGSAGILTIPNSGVITGAAGMGGNVVLQASPSNVAAMTNNSGYNQIYTQDTNVAIQTSLGNSGSIINTWSFDNSGHITFPDTTVQSTAFTGELLLTASAASITTNYAPAIGPFYGSAADSFTGNGYITFGGPNGNIHEDLLVGVDLSRLIGVILLDLLSNENIILSVTPLGDGIYSMGVSGPLATDTGGFGTSLTISAIPERNETWVFGTTGALTLPVGGDIKDSTGMSVLASSILRNETLPAESSSVVLDLTKQLHILGGASTGTSTYTLPDGSATGQMMYFLPLPGSTDNSATGVTIAVTHTTMNNGGNYAQMGTHTWAPFCPDPLIYVNVNSSGVPTAQAIWDGQGWNLSGGTTT